MADSQMRLPSLQGAQQVGENTYLVNYNGRPVYVQHSPGMTGSADVGYSPDPNRDQYVMYDPNNHGAGAQFFDGSGSFVKSMPWREASNNMLVPALAALTMGVGLPAMGFGGAGGGAAAGGSGAFLGEGVASGIPGWDAAAGMGGGGFGGAGAVSGMDMAADTPGWFGGGSGAMGAGAETIGAAGGVSPAMGAGGFAGDATAAGYGGLDAASAASMGGGASVAGGSALSGGAAGWLQSLGISPSMLGAGASLLGGALGSQGVQSSQTTSSSLNPALNSAIFGDVVPRTQGLLNDQMPAATAAGQQMASVGSGLLGMQRPTTAQNPYLSGMADDIGRRTQDLLGQNNMAIQGQSVGAGGLGGSRQGVAQGLAAGKAADYLQGNLSNLYGQNYQFDQNNYLNSVGLGANLTNTGLGLAWQPLKSAMSIYGPAADATKTTTSTSSQGGGAMGVLGGVLGGAQLAKNAGWW